MIAKIQNDPSHYKLSLAYYDRARDAMFDIVHQLLDQGFTEIYIPGYIGWSPKEGSGIFDPLNRITGLQRHYYRMTGKLEIDASDLENKLKGHSILLIINYFGFRDRNFRKLTDMAHSRGCVVLEDNAHGFYTYFCRGRMGADATFFSLHKMFPFVRGGALFIENTGLKIAAEGSNRQEAPYNPFQYDINSIADARSSNFKRLAALAEGWEDYFVPLREVDALKENIPQSFPVVIRQGDRNKIYEIMNARGYGVVTLYHTMIEELRREEHRDACRLSEHIMNFPVHQDCDPDQYQPFIEAFIESCRETR